MQEVWVRVFLAATISAMGVLGTFIWSRSHRAPERPRDEDPIARILLVNNDVQRRPAERLIWQRTLRTQELYNGEAVRTGPNSTAQIEFIGKNAVADLEPDTVIEIEKTADGVNLDFLVGNLVIRAKGGGPANNITVQSGQQKVEVNNADVAMVKNAAVGPIDVDIIKGNVKVTDGKNKAAQVAPKLKVLRPKRDDLFYGDPGKGAVVTFEWESFKANGYEVYLETGRDRGKLKRDFATTSVPLEKGQLRATLGLGKTYFRLIAKGKDEIPSVVSAVEMKTKLPPQLLSPAPDTQVAVSEPLRQVEFSWANHGELVDLRIEVARDAMLKDPLAAQAADKPLQQTLRLPDLKGALYWRVSGKIPDTNLVISSPVQKFTLGQVELPPLTTPQLTAPSADEKIPFLKMQQEGMWLTWSPVVGANNYDFTLNGWKIYSENVVSPRIHVAKLQPGEYQWSVVAKTGDARQSGSSETRSFTVEQNPVLLWADGLQHTKQVYKTAQPTLSLKWEKGPGQAVRWRARISPLRKPASDSDWKVFETTEMSMPLEGPGQYKAEAESLDASGTVIARTVLRTIQMEQAPPLHAPEFVSTLASPIRGKADGSADVEWKPVADAKQYVLKVKSREGEILQTLTVDSTKTRVKGLKSGNYVVSLQTIDGIGRTGPEGRARGLAVPEFSNVLPPKIKALKVK